MAIKWKNNNNDGENDKSAMAVKGKNNSMKSLLLVLLCAATAAVVMCESYPLFRKQAQKNIEAYQKEESTQEVVQVEVDEDFERYLLSSIYYMNYETTPNMNAYEYFTQNYDVNKLTVNEQDSVQEAASRLMRNMRNQYKTVQSLYDYSSYALGVDDTYYGTDGNLRELIYGNDELAKEYYQAGIVITYDGRGVPSIRDYWNLDMSEGEVLEYLKGASMSRLMEDNGLYILEYEEDVGILTEGALGEEEFSAVEELHVTDAITEDSYEVARYNDKLLRQLPVPLIQNATFAFGIHENYENETWRDYWIERNAYLGSGYPIGVFGIAVSMLLMALILQNLPVLELRKNRLFCLPTEVVVFAGCMGLGATVWVLGIEFGMYTMTERIVEDFQAVGFGNASSQAATVFIWVFWFCAAFCWYWLVASILPYITHPIRTLKERMLCISICSWMKKCWLRIWHWATDVELDENLTRNIWKIVGLNGIVAAALCCIWIGGIAGALIYTIILYVVIKKKCYEILTDYQKLLNMTRAIAGGELNTSMDENVGLFNPVRDELSSIQSGFRKAVNEEVRSRNMKTELITNVSHDLKTPLTAIITYVDLLKKEDITEEERRNYIDTLDKKSQRLKVLIEDLFEVSKATTNNITMNFDDVDLVNLIKQVRLENEDKIAESTLDFRWNLPDEKCILLLDPQKTFRVIDNLVQNILKYSMPHSRVYIDMRDIDGEVVLNFKNMSATEMNFSPEEITERFVRGDLSRNTEGSGLGLAIAQSFTELQKGTFRVETDGDLFKVVICWRK